MAKEHVGNIDPLEGGVELSDQAVAFGKIGDFIKGTLTRVERKITTKFGIKDKYEIKGQFGLYHKLKKIRQGVFEPTTPPIDVQPGTYHTIWSGKKTIDDLVNRSKVGDIVAFRFESEKEGDKGTLKIFLAKNYGRDEAWMGEDSKTEVIDVEQNP